MSQWVWVDETIRDTDAVVTVRPSGSRRDQGSRPMKTDHWWAAMAAVPGAVRELATTLAGIAVMLMALMIVLVTR